MRINIWIVLIVLIASGAALSRCRRNSISAFAMRFVRPSGRVCMSWASKMVPSRQDASFPAAETPACRPLVVSRNVLLAKGDLSLSRT